jgi:hypothetical protein
MGDADISVSVAQTVSLSLSRQRLGKLPDLRPVKVSGQKICAVSFTWAETARPLRRYPYTVTNRFNHGMETTSRL